MASERLSFERVSVPELTSGLLSRAWDTIICWHERAQARQALSRFDARMREDIGVTEADVWRETRLPFWRSAG